MADALVSLVVQSVVQRLGDLLVEEGKFLYGLRDQVEDIHIELRCMQSFLRDAAARQDEDERIHNLLAEIREITYAAEDVIETFAGEVASRRGRGGIKIILKRLACIFNEGIARHKIGSEIRTIKNKMTNLTTSFQVYGIRALSDEGESSNSAYERHRWSRMSYSHVVEEDFVAMNEELNQLVSRLVNEDQHWQVVSICGMGGLGKTALAKKVYNLMDVRRHFDRLAWVCISQQWQVQDILQRILIELIPEKRERMVRVRDEDLFMELYKILKEKKCLVVLDDIWSMDAWNSLRPAFPVGETVGSKILLTTRVRNVADVGFIYELRFLNLEESWNLLQKKAFPERGGQEYSVDSEMVKLGREMVQACRGLPLAICVLGGLLKGKRTLSDWKMVHQNIESNLRRDWGVYEMLALSYNELPYQLKSCFLYLGHFLEDSDIEVEKLYQLWIAEGMVSPNDQDEEETMMDVAERYLGELAQRSMVQVTLVGEEESWSTTRRYKSCRLHDLMRDLCLSKGKEEHFLKIIDSRRYGKELALALDSSSLNGSTKTRRLAIYLDEDGDRYVPLSQETTRHLRSLLLLNAYGWCIGLRWPKEISDIKDCKSLRVLDVEGIWFCKKKLPKGIAELMHLRYLSLRNCYLEELPSSIGNLGYLQTLDLRVDGPIIIPNVLWKLEQLRHLYLPYIICIKDKLLRLDGLSNLETLINFDTSVCNVKDLLKFTNLRRLEEASIWGKLEYLAEIISYLNVNVTSNHLRHSSFHIKNCDFRLEEGLTCLRQLLGCRSLVALWIYGRIGKLPEYDHQFSSSLTKLFLCGSELEDDPMATLEKLPNLRSLSLKTNAFVGEEMGCSALGFPQLRSLKLWLLYNLERWRVDVGAMPNLSLLEIDNCHKLEMVPDGLKFVVALRELKIFNMPEAFQNRLQVGQGVDFHKVRHLPSITILNFD